MILLAFSFVLPYFVLSLGAPVSTTPPDEKGELVFLRTYRSTIQIIWTCLTIVFASTWVCIHPHVYGYKSTLRQRIGRRIRLFSNALLFPDHFVQRAFEQWIGYRELYAHMRERAEGLNIDLELPSGESLWTPVHAHFIQMGGVIFRSSRGGVKSVEPSSRNQSGPEVTVRDKGSFTPKETPGGDDDLERQGSDEAKLKPQTARVGDDTSKDDVRWYKDFSEWDANDVREFFKLELTEAQIEDRSKADGLAKAFVVTQCLWFVVQCIGRAVYGLPVLELEVTCLAFIACNIGMYCFWWKKPMNVVCPVEIHRRKKRLDITATGPTAENVNIGDWIVAAFEALRSGDVGFLSNPSQRYSEFKTIEPTSKPYPANYLYSRTGMTDEVSLLQERGSWPWVIYTIAPAIFGALHSIGWYSSFPSATEQLLWRASCVIPTVHALLLMSATLSLMINFSVSLPYSWLRIACKALGAIVTNISMYVHFFISSPLNLAARFAFIILPLLQLRNLPPLAHQTVPWSDFLPHV
ncbi:hypothetical protein NMY22_g2063 [Coprinellus aureogranulatus]|nr:hypothetical protein NMY22_g2063 [Coprinellus aureogranulatus]